MQYVTVETDFPFVEALGLCTSTPSSFLVLPSERGRSTTLVDRRGKTTYYFWQKGSATLKKLRKIAANLNFPSEHPSWSRLSRWVWEETVAHTPSDIRPYPTYISYARDKSFWHYTKCVPGTYRNTTEIDIKSAYASAICSNESLLLASPGNWKPDDSRLENFKLLYPSLDKALRLALIGWLSSFELQSFVPNLEKGGILEPKIFRKCYDGGIFNSIHFSLNKLHKLLAEIDKVGGDYIPRIHTDSLWINRDMPDTLLKRILELLRNAGYEIACKGYGRAFLFDLNSGMINGCLFGIPRSTLTQLKKLEDAGTKGLFEREEIDERFSHLPYKNERFTWRQTEEIIAKYSPTYRTELLE